MMTNYLMVETLVVCKDLFKFFYRRNEWRADSASVTAASENAL